MTNSSPLRPLPPEGFPNLGGGQDLLVYDGDCRFCHASAGRLLRLAGPKLRLVSLHEPGLLEALAISQEAAMQAMHLITPEGRVFRGLEAAVQALRHRPIVGVLAKAYYLPGLRQLGDLGYRLVARYRYAIMGRAVAAGECDGGSCKLHLKQR